MRAVVQRVLSSHVEVDGQIVGQIKAGCLVLLGVGQGDDDACAKFLADKIANLRIFSDDQGKMNRSVVDVGGEVLVVSQFTLYGDCRKGRRPSFASAAPPAEANRLYELFCKLVGQNVHVERGIFQADMKVHLVNDGPVTLILEYPETTGS
jgi:D-tyrosyl-tRNA(Tyr) deacylase